MTVGNKSTKQGTMQYFLLAIIPVLIRLLKQYKPAISREDNKEVCPRCGLIEALEAAGYSEEDMQAAIKFFDGGAGKYQDYLTKKTF